ncbi:hypothetical protein ABZV34_34525 [Streptomyces sp. NPDC005195]
MSRRAGDHRPCRPNYAHEPENVHIAHAHDEWHGNHLYPESVDDPAAR